MSPSVFSALAEGPALGGRGEVRVRVGKRLLDAVAAGLGGERAELEEDGVRELGGARREVELRQLRARAPEVGRGRGGGFGGDGGGDGFNTGGSI